MGYLVGGMHLNRKLLARVDELDEQGKLIAETAVVVLAHEFSLELGHYVVELPSGPRTVADNAFVILHP